MIALIAIAWALVGLILGIWRTKNFHRRLDAKYPNTPTSRVDAVWCLLVLCWVPAWPVLGLLDERLSRNQFGRDS
jgi:hypothetical protein